MNWTDGFLGAITVCDRDGIVVYMNDLSKTQFDSDGGESLVGKCLIDCHETSFHDAVKCSQALQFVIAENDAVP